MNVSHRNLAGIDYHWRSNSVELLVEVERYYAAFPEQDTQSRVSMEFEHGPAAMMAGDWNVVPREVGKQGLKESYQDTENGRWILKNRTGMYFLQQPDRPKAVGDCLTNLPQVVNFINNQAINFYLNQGYMLGHASAFQLNNNAVAIAAASGGGKSTLMLRCLEYADTQFLSNDRVLFQNHVIQGIPKWPRVNPGTLLNSRRLVELIAPEKRQKLKSLSLNELWNLEDKHDVFIDQMYGAGRVNLNGTFGHLVMLDWSFKSSDPTRLLPVTDPIYIDGMRKRPGPFYQDSNGTFPPLDTMSSCEEYHRAMPGTQVWRITGKVDFDTASELIMQAVA